MRCLSTVVFAGGVLTVATALTFMGSGHAQEPSRPVVDATLSTATGADVRLASERGQRLVVLFYEDRPHLEVNDRLKRDLRQWIRAHGLEAEIVTYGVANLLRVPDYVPRPLVISQVRPLVDRWGSDILLDWEGVMRRPPWTMRGNSANVAILDREGRLVWHTVGAVEGTRRDSFYDTLRHYMTRSRGEGPGKP